MSTSAIRKIFTLTRKARAISGNDAQKMSQSKNERLTAGQPAEREIARTTSARKTIVLATAIRTPRTPPPSMPARIFERRSSAAPGSGST